MLDRNKQINVLQPQQVFSDWFEGLQNLGSGTIPQNWQETIDFIERQINGTLDIQVQSMKNIITNMQDAPGVPGQFVQWFQRLDQCIELSSDTQRRLWEVWFEMLRSTTSMTQNPGTIMMGNWQEIMDNTLSMQEQFLNNLPGVEPVSAGKTTARRKKSAASGNSPRTRSRNPAKKGS